MKITHFLIPDRRISEEADADSFLISNRKGDYLWMHEHPKSRYEGWFCRLNEKLYRIIEGLEIDGGGRVLEIQNGFNYIERKRENVEEIFYIADSSHGFVYELNERRRVNIFFDVRESYSSAETEDYNFKREGEFLIIDFVGKPVMVIGCEDGENAKEIIKRYYSYDEKRNSHPFHRNIYKGVSLYGQKFVFAVAESKSEALKEAKKVFLRSVFKEEEDLDVLCAKRSLAGLLVPEERGCYAGLPWFFQFWPRDAAISLKSIISIDSQAGKDVFFRLIEEGLQNGPGGAINIDAVGWTFKRVNDVLPLVDIGEKEKIRRSLKMYIEEFLWSFTEEGLTVNRPKETWMDSLDRSGARIELQAMKMNMYKTASLLAKNRNERIFYKKLEEEMKKRVRKAFFDGENLYDGYYPRKKVVDKTVRPNIFIAAYIYPEMLSKKEWISCFNSNLPKLWLPWGGVATLERESTDFHDEHTGENAKSYHQGDSWFYLNNLTAIVLYRFDKKRFARYIDEIMMASEKEMLWMGAVGHHGEVSSAKELRSEGCVNQAWSSAMYLEAKNEIKNM